MRVCEGVWGCSGASGNEFDWKYIQIAIEGNLALVRIGLGCGYGLVYSCAAVTRFVITVHAQVTYMAFARLLSRYNARDVSSTLSAVDDD